MTGPVVPAPALAATQTAPEPDLAAFVGLVGLVLTGFLVLARLSQRVVDEDDRTSADDQIDADDRSDPNASRRANFDLDTARDPGRESGRDAEGSDADGSDAPGSSPVAHPLAPDGAVGRDSLSDDRVAQDRDGRPADPPPVSRAAEPPATMSPGMLLVNVALTQGLFGVVIAGGAWYFGVPADALGLGGDPLVTGLPALAVGVGFGVVLWVGNELASGLAAASDADYDEGLRELLAPAGARGWALLLGATLPVIAVVEEFIFRAAVIGGTTAAFDTSAWALAVLSSAAFALGHGAQGRVGVVVTGGLGFALAAAFVLTDSLLVVVVAHYLVNALEFAVHEGFGLPDPIWA